MSLPHQSHQNDLIRISQMASMHGISRQTLILYDKNGLLKPAYVSSNGYRYYSISQIPYLRLICLLKQMGVSLADIGSYMRNRSARSLSSLLDQRCDAIQGQVDQLQEQLREIRQLQCLFQHASTAEKNVGLPRVEWLPRRRAIFSPYPSDATKEEQMDVRKLHLALMGAWGQLLEAGMLPSSGFGSMLVTDNLAGDEPLAGAGSIVIVPDGREVEGAHMVELPEGEYVTMYKLAMPYEVSPTRQLLQWMDQRGLKPAPQLFDLCILDTAFYDQTHTRDLCRIDVPLVTRG